ncbi:alkaline phosphatase [Ferrimonas balearica]|uniref:alkaline phosphatase n=1 Tax=Ferrimonas balearica TaxID=44012 RepID=UPI001C583917|nr:alkaline phosphatase [Ferrimonas balearica]MBW3164086.1 alkaline phosphatase [Ferrimonas balearica]
MTRFHLARWGWMALLLLCTGCASESPRNIIYVIGDGMGPAYTTAYRYYLAEEPGNDIPNTVFDRLTVGSASTYPDDDTFVTDSAAAATALATGQKSYNGAIGLNRNKAPLDSLLLEAKRRGMHTGLVATAQVTHATPASFVAHADSRSDYDTISPQFLQRVGEDDALLLDLILSGGQRYFPMTPDGLGEQMRQQGYHYIDSLDDLPQLTKLPVLGLFADKGMPYAIDDDRPDRLRRMLEQALTLLTPVPADSWWQRLRQGWAPQPGFFLMVEGSQIDWCGHGNDIACAMAEMAEFASAIELAEAYAQQHGDTLVVVTADHSTGGLSLGRDGHYQWLPKRVKEVHHSLKWLLTTAYEEDVALATLWPQFASVSPEAEQFAQWEEMRADRKALRNSIQQWVSARSHTGWTTGGHTAVDVPVMATGPGAEHFIGHHDNDDLAMKLWRLLP